MPPTNAEIANLFENMATLLEMKGDAIFKIRAYQRSARTIEQLPFPLEQAVSDGMDLKSIPGIGDAISKKIQEMVSTGQVAAYEKLRAELPEGVLSLMNVPGIGPKTAMLVAQELGTRTIEEMEQAALDGRIASLPRMGEKSAQNILRRLRYLRSKDKRVPVGKARQASEHVISALRDASVGVDTMSAVGSLRRWKETIGDIDIMGTAPDPAMVMEALAALPDVQEVLVKGPKKTSVVVDSGLQVDLRIVEKESLGAMLQYFTGSQQHNVRLRDYANQRGLSLNEYGITTEATGTLEKYAREEDFYARLDLPWIPPELREGMWEIEAAQKGELPALVQESDIKGDLHVHTDWSDGNDSLESMVAAAVERGHQYIAFTDHSMGRGNGLSSERLSEQIELLRDLDKHVPINVLCGSEVDIQADGRLEYPNDVLEKLDVVVAAVHSAMGQDSPTMTQRLITAMHNPHVTIVGHPTGRLLGSREPVELDMEALFKAALETGTALEVNSSPERLDLRDTHVLRARELGVPLVIGTDAHDRGQLDNMAFGVAVARRGWCEPPHILNTLPYERLYAYLRTPKHRRPAMLTGRIGAGAL